MPSHPLRLLNGWPKMLWQNMKVNEIQQKKLKNQKPTSGQYLHQKGCGRVAAAPPLVQIFERCRLLVFRFFAGFCWFSYSATAYLWPSILQSQRMAWHYIRKYAKKPNNLATWQTRVDLKWNLIKLSCMNTNLYKANIANTTCATNKIAKTPVIESTYANATFPKLKCWNQSCEHYLCWNWICWS